MSGVGGVNTNQFIDNSIQTGITVDRARKADDVKTDQQIDEAIESPPQSNPDAFTGTAVEGEPDVQAEPESANDSTIDENSPDVSRADGDAEARTATLSLDMADTTLGMDPNNPDQVADARATIELATSVEELGEALANIPSEGMTAEEEAQFVKYISDSLDANFGMVQYEAGVAARELFNAIKPGVSPGDRLKAGAVALARLNQVPGGDRLVASVVDPMVNKLPEGIRGVARELYAKGNDSVGLINDIATLADGQFNTLKDLKAGVSAIAKLGPHAPAILNEFGAPLNRLLGNGWSADATAILADLDELTDDDTEMKDAQALYNMMDKMGDRIKTMLPPHVQANLDRLENYAEEVLGKSLKNVLKNTLPGGKNSAAALSVMKFINANDPVEAAGAGLEFMKNIGQRIVGTDNRAFNAVANFIQLDGPTKEHLKNLIGPDTSPQQRGESLRQLAETFEGRINTLKDTIDTRHVPEDILRQFDELGQGASDVAARVTGDAMDGAVDAVTGAADNSVDDIADRAGRLVADSGLDDATKTAMRETITGLPPEKADAVLRQLEANPRVLQDTVFSNTNPQAAFRETVNTLGARADIAGHIGKVGAELSTDVEARLVQVATGAGLNEAQTRKAVEMLAELPPEDAQRAITQLQDLNDPALTRRFVGADNVGKAMDDVLSPAVNRRIAAQMTTRLTESGLGPQGQEALTRVLAKEGMDDNAMRAVTEMVERMGPESGERMLQMMASIDNSSAIKLLANNSEYATKALGLIDEAMPTLSRMGLSFAEVAPKFAKGLGKAIPALGAAVSAYDTARLGTIAMTGEWDGKTYSDPDVRALALIGAGLNGADTALAIAEAFGVGNVALPINLGLAGAEVAVDIMVEYYGEHPEKMPQELRTAIKATALGIAVGMPGPGTAAVAQIYGLDGTIDIANEMTRLVGETTLAGLDYATELHAEALDQGLEGLADGMHGMADVIRNPEKYAAALGKEVGEVLSEAGAWMDARLAEGGEAVQEVMSALGDIIENPGEYGEMAAQWALEKGTQAMQAIGDGAQAAKEFVVSAVKNGAMAARDGAVALYNMGAEGVAAAREFGAELLQAGGEKAAEFMAFAQDVYNNPGEYGAMVAGAIQDAAQQGWEMTTEAFDGLVTMAGNGIDAAGQAISDAVAKGGELATRALTALENAPAQVAEAIGRGYDAALEAGKATLDMVQYVANNPGKVAQALGEAGQQMLLDSREWLVNSVKDGVNGSIEALENLYTNGSEYMADLAERTGAALGRFEDTVVDLMKQGVDVGGEIVDRYWNVLSTRVPEVLDAMGDLAQAPVDLMVRLGKKGGEAAAQVAQYLGSRAAELGQDALDGLRQLGSEGMEQLGNLAEAGGRMASQAIDSLSRMGQAGWDQIYNLAEAGGQAASEALGAIKGAAARGGREALALMERAATGAGEMASWAINEMKDMGTRGAQMLEDLVTSGAARANEAFQALQGMGSRAIDNLANIAERGGRMASQALDALGDMGSQAIDELKQLAMSGGRMAQAAFDELKGMGNSAINAIRDVGKRVESFAGQAIDTLARMGSSAEQAIRDIGTSVRGAADEAIDALKGMGSRAADSIKAIADRYTHLRDDAIQALSTMGSSASRYVNELVDDLWASGSAGISSLMNMADSVGQVASRVMTLVGNKLSDGWDRSVIDLNPFNSVDTDLSPLKDAVGDLLSKARRAGGEAFNKMKDMLRNELRDLGVPGWAIDIVL